MLQDQSDSHSVHISFICWATWYKLKSMHIYWTLQICILKLNSSVCYMLITV